MTHVEEVGQSGSGRILSGVFETLERSGVRYCVSHGYDGYPQTVPSDVDGVIDPDITPSRLHALLRSNGARIGAEIVRCNGYHIVLAGRDPDHSRCFLTLDLGVDCELDGLPFRAGRELLESRRRYRGFWIPAANVEFGCYLARTIAKGRLDDERAHRLSKLYRQDAARCHDEATRLWGERGSALIVSAARSGDWSEVRQRLGSLRAELRRRAVLRSPGRFARNKLHALAGRMKRVWRPEGLNVVLLGPDGAGKSSVIEAMGPRLACAFARSTCWGFAPPVLSLFRRRAVSTDQPHGLPPRSRLISLVRAAYWLAYHILGYPRLRLALARSTLVLHDRHFVDILVDARRYRYGGPLWLLRLIWRVIPKPDLIILLDAPAEVLQMRKQEVPFDETARQRAAYLSLVRTMGNGHVVDASQPFEQVAGEVSDILLRHLTLRIASRVSGPSSRSAMPLEQPALRR